MASLWSSTTPVTPQLIDAIAHSLDITGLAPDAAKALAIDADFKLRELIQVEGCSGPHKATASFNWLWLGLQASHTHMAFPGVKAERRGAS
jgi:hypothetical protein